MNHIIYRQYLMYKRSNIISKTITSYPNDDDEYEEK